MSTPTWVELVGRNAAAETVYVSGSLRVIAKDGDDVRFQFWHGPHGQWRIERDGEVIYLCGAGQTPLALIDGAMCRQGGDLGVVHLGSQFSPVDLLGPDSLLHHMSQGMRVAQPPHSVEVGGRTGWSTTLVSGSDVAVEIAVDDGTGIIVAVRSPEHGRLLEVSDLVEHTTISDDRFVWDGPVVDAEVRRRR